MEDPNALNIYTDGSSYSKPRRGGIGMVFVFPEYLNKEPLEICPFGYQKATSNQMEIMACVKALEESLKFDKTWNRILIHTDSQYVCDNYPRAAFQWSSKQWTKSGGAPVANILEWKMLLKAVQKTLTPVDFVKVKGHAKNPYNNTANKLAQQSAQKANINPLNNVNLRRKTSSNATKIGSVKMVGQMIRIRIITSIPESKKPTKYRYEVTSKRSPFFRNVDFIYSKKVMRVGREFLIKVNNNQEFPQVVKIYKDLTEEKKLGKGGQEVGGATIATAERGATERQK